MKMDKYDRLDIAQLRLRVHNRGLIPQTRKEDLIRQLIESDAQAFGVDSKDFLSDPSSGITNDYYIRYEDGRYKSFLQFFAHNNQKTRNRLLKFYGLADYNGGIDDVVSLLNVMIGSDYVYDSKTVDQFLRDEKIDFSNVNKKNADYQLWLVHDIKIPIYYYLTFVAYPRLLRKNKKLPSDHLYQTITEEYDQTLFDYIFELALGNFSFFDQLEIVPSRPEKKLNYYLQSLNDYVNYIKGKRPSEDIPTNVEDIFLFTDRQLLAFLSERGFTTTGNFSYHNRYDLIVKVASLTNIDLDGVDKPRVHTTPLTNEQLQKLTPKKRDKTGSNVTFPELLGDNWRSSFQVKTIKGNGDCLYCAIVTALNQLPEIVNGENPKFTVAEARRLIADQVDKDPGYWRQEVKDEILSRYRSDQTTDRKRREQQLIEQPMPIKEIKDYIQNQNRYGTETDLRVLSEIWEFIPIIVPTDPNYYTSICAGVLDPGSISQSIAEDSDYILLKYDPGGVHYDLIVDNRGNAIFDFEQIKNTPLYDKFINSCNNLENFVQAIDIVR